MDFNIFFRLILGGLLPGIIGLEREYRSKEAGFRTHFLVGLGSALIMIISIYGFVPLAGINGITIDISKMGSQIVSGIGFIGAGTIILNKNIVKGLTTSAGIWVSAGIGISIGVGLINLAIISTLITIICLEIVHIFNKNREFKILSLKLHLEYDLEETISIIKNNYKNVDLLASSIVSNEISEMILYVECRIYKNEEEILEYIEYLRNSKLEIIKLKISGA